MAWIQVIDEHEATGELKEVYESQRSQAGSIANILKIHSLKPATLTSHLALYHDVMHGRGKLGRPQREMIAVVVSALNRCHY